MITLSIDVGTTNNGYALFEEANYIGSGTLISNSKTIIDKFKEIYTFFDNILIFNKVDTIIYENPQTFINKKIEHDLLKVCGIFETLAIIHGSKCFNYHPCTIKKTITGSGKANKTQVKESIIDKIGNEVINKTKQTHHSIDAIGVGLTHFILQAKKH